MKQYNHFWCSGCGCVGLEIPQSLVDDQPTSGPCDVSVKEAQPTLAKQFEGYPAQTLIDLATEYGANDYGNEGVLTLKQAKEFITWIAIGDLQEDQFYE